MRYDFVISIPTSQLSEAHISACSKVIPGDQFPGSAMVDIITRTQPYWKPVGRRETLELEQKIIKHSLLEEINKVYNNMVNINFEILITSMPCCGQKVIVLSFVIQWNKNDFGSTLLMLC